MQRRIADLETKIDLLEHVVFAFADTARPKGAEYAILALACGFTAEQMAALDEFWKWASKQDQSKLNKDDFVREFDARMPVPLKGKLEMILRADQADGRRPFYTRLVLGEGSAAPELTDDSGDSDD
jgi:hypothetical protein